MVPVCSPRLGADFIALNPRVRIFLGTVVVKSRAQSVDVRSRAECISAALWPWAVRRNREHGSTHLLSH